MMSKATCFGTLVNEALALKDFFEVGIGDVSSTYKELKLVFLRDHVLDLACLMCTQVH